MNFNRRHNKRHFGHASMPAPACSDDNDEEHEEDGNLHGQAQAATYVCGRSRFSSESRGHTFAQRLRGSPLKVSSLCRPMAALNVSRSRVRVTSSTSSTPRYQQVHGVNFQFSVASYNVLAQCYLEEMAQLYRHCPEQYLAWHYRKENILRQLEYNQPDIICLQEVQQDHYELLFNSRLAQLGYKGHYKKRTRHKLDGCATFYKRSKFTCLNSVPVEFYVPGSRLLDRDNIALLLTLSAKTKGARGVGRTGERRQDGPCICVANTHLLYNPKCGDVKLAQLMFLMAAIDEVAAQTIGPDPSYDPVILCGDFNIKYGSDLYHFITDGELYYDGLLIQTLSGQLENGWGRAIVAGFLPREMDITDQCQFYELMEHRRRQLIHARRRGQQQQQDDRSFGSGIVSQRFGFRSAYSYDDGSITSWIKHPVCGTVVDYIFYSTDNRRHQHDSLTGNERLKLLEVIRLPAEGDVWNAGGLPNEQQSSDHLMLMATFALVNH